MYERIRKVFKLLIPPVFFFFRKNGGKSIKKKRQLTPNLELIDSYSQVQEDLIIDAILGKKDCGFYIDVGANDTMNLNNTRRFYLKGWRGINVEPQVNLFNKLLIDRPNDINVNAGVAREFGELSFFNMEFNELSTFDYDTAQKNSKLFKCKILDVELVPVLRLEDLLDKYLPLNQKIDFISIDTEGYDLEVLESNNWRKYSPEIILIEYGDKEIEINDFLTKHNYRLVYNNHLNVVYKYFEISN